MNKIVREHYPAANLPEDLRAELEGVEAVRVTIEAETRGIGSIRAVLAEAKRLRSVGLLPVVSEEEAVSRVRAMRDAWEP